MAAENRVAGAHTYNLVDYREADTVLADFKPPLRKRKKSTGSCRRTSADAFLELVLYPTKASAIVTELYIIAGRNQLYASQGRASANDLAAQARRFISSRRGPLCGLQSHTGARQVDHMMDQTHIGYTYWQQPPVNAMPKISEIKTPAAAKLGVALEVRRLLGRLFWRSTLPPFDVFNRQTPLHRHFQSRQEPFYIFDSHERPLDHTERIARKIEKERRVWISVDWDAAPVGLAGGYLKIGATRKK